MGRLREETGTGTLPLAPRASGAGGRGGPEEGPCEAVRTTPARPPFVYNDGMDIFDKPPRRDIQVNFQVTAQEKSRLDAAAKKANMSVAEYIRTAVNEKARRGTQPKKKKKKS